MIESSDIELEAINRYDLECSIISYLFGMRYTFIAHTRKFSMSSMY